MEEEITPKEHTWLVLKHGPEYARRLYWTSKGLDRSGIDPNFSEVEKKAAQLGEKIVNAEETYLIKEMTEQIKKK